MKMKKKKVIAIIIAVTLTVALGTSTIFFFYRHQERVRLEEEARIDFVVKQQRYAIALGFESFGLELLDFLPTWEGSISEFVFFHSEEMVTDIPYGAVAVWPGRLTEAALEHFNWQIDLLSRRAGETFGSVLLSGIALPDSLQYPLMMEDLVDRWDDSMYVFYQIPVEWREDMRSFAINAYLAQED